jgi:hypothetical protein
VVKRKEEVLELLQQWADNPFKFQSMGEINRDYIQRQAGATAHIINTLDSVE